MPLIGSGTGIAQDADLQDIIVLLGGPIIGMPNGSGTGQAQDASLQQIAALIGGASLPGGLFEIRVAVGLASVSSVAKIPSGAIVSRAYFVNNEAGDAAYSVGTTITLGTAATPNLFMLATDINATAQQLNDKLQDTVQAGAAAPLLVTVAGAPAAGSGHAVVEFATALA